MLTETTLQPMVYPLNLGFEFHTHIEMKYLFCILSPMLSVRTSKVVVFSPADKALLALSDGVGFLVGWFVGKGKDISPYQNNHIEL